MVEKTNQSVKQVAETAQRAQDRILEINDSIDQISKVVQTNSATAEENAAASEELSGQSQVLKQMIGRFTIKGSDYHQIGHSSEFIPNNQLLEAHDRDMLLNSC